jgi:hypothetical protein
MYLVDRFDLPEYQQEAREAKSAKMLFALWDKVCSHYDRGQIGRYELEEMRDLVWEQMTSLVKLQSQIDASFSVRKAS